MPLRVAESLQRQQNVWLCGVLREVLRRRQEGPKIFQEGPTTVPREPKMATRGLQGIPIAPKSLMSRPGSAPQTPQGALRERQDVPMLDFKMSQGALETP